MQGETGSTKELEDLQIEIQAMMDAWKATTYPDAWKYMTECANSVLNPGYLKNPWGRTRRFQRNIAADLVAGMQREAMNFPIQSTVADTCMVALQLMVEYRAKHKTPFTIINQIHDAVIVECPKEALDEIKAMFKATMGSIDIPIEGKPSLRLGIDIEAMTRWGEKVKK